MAKDKKVAESSVLAWASKARKQDDVIVLRTPASRRPPVNHGRTATSEQQVAKQAGNRRRRTQVVDRGPSSRSEWPWGFMQDLATCEDEEILELMDDIVTLFQYECTRRAGVLKEKHALEATNDVVVLASNGHLVSKYNQKLQLFTVHSVVELTATLADVVELVLGSEDAFLRRVFRDEDLIQLHTLATIGKEDIDPSDLSDHEMYVPTSCTLKKVLFRERGIFLTHPKEILFLDHVQAMSSTSLLRVFKSIDNGNYPTTSREQIVPRHTHIMGGFLFEAVPLNNTVRVTYYAEHAVYPKQFAGSLDTRTRLEKFGLGLPTWQHAIPRRSSGQHLRKDKRIAQRHEYREKACRICEKEFHWFRRTCLCSMCTAAVCPDCSTLESVESPNGLRFQVPVCFMCLVQVRSNEPDSNVHAKSNYQLKGPPSIENEDNGSGFTESSIGQYVPNGPQRTPPTSLKSPHAKCQLCSMPGSAFCVICGFMYCDNCADTQSDNVVCHLCTRNPSEIAPIVLFEGPLLGSKSSGDTAMPPVIPPQVDSHDEFGRYRETYASTLRSSMVLQDTSFSSVEDLMAIYPVRRSTVANFRVSGESSSILTEDVPPEDSTPRSHQTDASSNQSTVSTAEVEAACLDMESNAAHDALCERALVEMECTNAYTVLLYKDQFMLKGAAGTSYVPATIPGMCAFCIHTVASATDPLIVPDATVDGRFQDSVRVQGKEAIRFYYGLPLRTKAGQVLGTVCVVDTAPRMRIGRNQKHTMERFAHDVVQLIHAKAGKPTTQPQP